MLDTIYITVCCGHHPFGRPVVFSFGLARDVAGQPPPPAPQYCRRINGGSDVDQAIETQQFQTLSVRFVDRRGQPAPTDGTPQWATDNSDLLTLEPAADGLSCLVTTGTMPGSARVQVTADADLGDGVVLIAGVVSYTITQPQASTVEVRGDTPADTP